MKIWHALKQYKQLPYTFIYLFSFFLLADVSLQLLLASPPPPTISHTFIPFSSISAYLWSHETHADYPPSTHKGLNTTGTLVSICQNDKFQFSFLQNTYLGLAQAITSTASTLGFWYIQKWWKIGTKPMVCLPFLSILSNLVDMWWGKEWCSRDHQL